MGPRHECGMPTANRAVRFRFMEIMQARFIQPGTTVTQLPPHPDAMNIAGFVDRSLSAVMRSRVEAHLAVCDACRREVLEVEQISRSAPSPRRPMLIPIGALVAAAAALFLVLWPVRHPMPAGGEHREPAVTTTVAPRAVEPLGNIGVLDSIRWSSVPGAERYSVTVFDASGTVLWQANAADTVIGVPSAVRLAPGDKFYWSVRARIGWDRWVESSLSEFIVLPGMQAP